MGVRAPKSKIERTTFCRGAHGEMTAKKWLDSNLKECDRLTDRGTSGQTDRQSQLLTIIDS